MDEFVLTVTGMDCRACEERIERSVARAGGVRRVSADHVTDRVTVVVDRAGSETAVRAGITAAGFEVKS
ncbi:heavy-metal-associated domain-containing protein [Ferrimicrobium acidiphilum]|uniref:Heavy-metal-associated domain-containing protein n=1 Tax=Ferrimicrobium acidiphilum TaxID=121039 RepID=A0ABV3Y6L7_9ACTN